MKVNELTSALAGFNPDADVVVNVSGERSDITGIWSWTGYDGEDPKQPRDIAKEKALTERVTLKTESSVSEEDRRRLLYVLVCHNHQDWSSAKVFGTFEEARRCMEFDYDTERSEMIFEGYDEDDIDAESCIDDWQARLFGDEGYCWEIHEVEM